jgi:hypothetical protein
MRMSHSIHEENGPGVVKQYDLIWFDTYSVHQFSSELRYARLRVDFFHPILL